MSYLKSALNWVQHREPAVAIGTLVSLGDAILAVVQGHPGQTWHALLPLIVSAVIRQFVTPVGGK